MDIRLKHNIFSSFRVQLAGYAIVSCILTFLSDVSALAFIQLVKWNLARITLKKTMLKEPEDIFTIMKQTEPGVWWLLVIITVFCFFVYYIVLSAPMVKYFREIISGVQRMLRLQALFFLTQKLKHTLCCRCHGL